MAIMLLHSNFTAASAWKSPEPAYIFAKRSFAAQSPLLRLNIANPKGYVMPANADLTWLFLLLPPLFIALFLGSIGRDWWIASQLRQHGTITDAEVIGLVKDSWRGTKNCYVEYTFRTAPNEGSREYSYRQPITEAHHDRLQNGDRIVVQYLPA